MSSHEALMKMSMASSNKASLKGDQKKIGFLQAWLLPRVSLYAVSFFCTKLAVYCLLLWLPLFLKEELNYGDK